MNKFREMSEPEVHRTAALRPERFFVTHQIDNDIHADDSPLSTPRQEKIPR